MSRLTWEVLTVRRLAGVLVAVAGAAIAFDATTKRLNAWWPNVAIGALSIAVTITVVDRLIKQDLQRRIARRQAQAYSRLDGALVGLQMHVVMDYIRTHLHVDVELSGDPAELLQRWREDFDATRIPPAGGWDWLHHDTVNFIEVVREVADGDREVLPDDLLAAINELSARLAKVTRDERDMPEIAKGEGWGQWRTLYLFSAAEGFAVTYREVRGDDWPTALFAVPVVVPAVQNDDTAP